jgi:hypothetical protein
MEKNMIKPRLYRVLLLLALLVYLLPTAAQDTGDDGATGPAQEAAVEVADALNLPAALFVLTNEGRVDRYGLGADGIRTVTPEDAFVLDFGVSPGGDWLAYRTENTLVLADLVGGVSRTLDTTSASVPPLRGQGASIAWAPRADAVAITTLQGGRVYLSASGLPLTEGADVIAVDLAEGAFHQLIWSPDGRYLAAEAADHVWWIYRREMTAMPLSSVILSSIGLAWVSNFEVAFAPAEGGLLIMNLSQANAQTLLLDTSWDYRLPHLAPDGTLKFFGRQKNDTVITPGYGRLVGLRAGVAEIYNLGEVAVELDSLQWTPDGELMMAFRDASLVLLDPAQGRAFPLPITNAVMYDWGVPGE